MGRALLIGNPNVAWREWLKTNRGRRDLLCLDPADPQQGIPARLCLFHGSRPMITRFYGSLDPQRAPHVLVAALAQALPKLGEDGLVQLFAYRATPLLHQAVVLISQMLQPSEIFVASGTEIDQAGFPVGPTEVVLEPSFPAMVQHAQRKAQWMRLLEDCEPHELNIRTATLEGTRLGSGRRLGREEIRTLRLEGARHAEKIGNSLFLVTEEELDEASVSRAMDTLGCGRVQFAHPSMYEGLLCAFSRADGEDFGMGTITSINWDDLTLNALCTAVAPAPVRVLRLGSLRIDKNGNELGEVRPWQV